MVARSQPDPLTQRTSTVSPNTVRDFVFTLVLPPPWRTRDVSRPSTRAVYFRNASASLTCGPRSARARAASASTYLLSIARPPHSRAVESRGAAIEAREARRRERSERVPEGRSAGRLLRNDVRVEDDDH